LRMHRVPNRVLSLAPFSRWTLCDNAAQTRIGTAGRKGPLLNEQETVAMAESNSHNSAKSGRHRRPSIFYLKNAKKEK
jgi:hypothetical protein